MKSSDASANAVSGHAKPVASFGRILVPDPNGYGPIIDGYVLPEDPQDAYAHGRQKHVPLLAGWNSAETKKFTDKFLPDSSVAGVEAALRKQFPDDMCPRQGGRSSRMTRRVWHKGLQGAGGRAATRSRARDRDQTLGLM